MLVVNLSCSKKGTGTLDIFFLDKSGTIQEYPMPQFGMIYYNELWPTYGHLHVALL